mgnify:CR=1 FL=1|tara:strand:- start:1119 stop:2141 length:1023 start_codon:yes stop_codon:yes gene_type:complete
MFITTNDKTTLFEDELLKNFNSYKNCIISVGFLSEEKLTSFRDSFLDIAKKGQFILIFGWSRDATENLVKFLKNLNQDISAINSKSGIYLSTETFHGKVYSFYDDKSAKVYLGSSNFSKNGFSQNIECNYRIDNFKECQKIIKFQKGLDKIIISDPKIKFAAKKIATKKLDKNGTLIIENVKTNNVIFDKLDVKKNHEFFEYPIYQKSLHKASNLNVSKASPKSVKNPQKRDPYEMEFILPSKEKSKGCSPEKNTPFEVIMDEDTVYRFICYGKNLGENLSTEGDHTILGRWLKGKLLKKKIISSEYDLIQQNHLKKLDMKILRFYKINENVYKLVVIPF